MADAAAAHDGVGGSSDGQPGKKWLPLESNPDVMNDFVRRLGLPESIASFHDVYGLDDELLAMVPQPVHAVLLLYLLPPRDASDEATAVPTTDAAARDSSVYFMRQTISNACGTIALLHAIGNNAHRLKLEPGSYLQRFFEKTKSMTPDERAKYLEDDTELERAHSAAASAGDTRPPSIEECTDLHFVALVEANNTLYELDGRKLAPISHGPSSRDTLLQDAAKVVKAFIKADPESYKLNVIALSSEQ